MRRSERRKLTLGAILAGGLLLVSYGGPHLRLADAPNARSLRVTSSDRGCDPNYSGACVPKTGRDVDCAGKGGDGPLFVRGPLRVVGSDRYLLDSDGDGIACEPFRR